MLFLGLNKLFFITKTSYKVFFAILTSIIFHGIFTMGICGVNNNWPLYIHKDSFCGECFCQDSVFPPFLEHQRRGCQSYYAFRPLAGQIKNCECREVNDYFLYPVFSHTRNTLCESWNIFHIINSNRCDGPCGGCQKLTIFPFIFYNHTGDPCTSYYGFFPIYGYVRNYFGINKIQWAFFPFYLSLQRGDTVRHGMPFPFIRKQTGPCSGGGALWPLYGHFWRRGDYNHTYFLWPLLYNNYDNLCACCPDRRHAFLPFYAYENSSKREMTTVIWPFFSQIRMKQVCYREIQFPWPFFVQGRGDCKYVNRWAPIYSHSICNGKEKRWFLWPLLKIQRWNERGMCIKQDQLLYFLYWDQQQFCCEDPCFHARKTHLWPLFSYWDNGCGKKQFQFLSPFETFFPTNKAVRLLYSPLFAIFKAEQIRPGHTRQSLFFDLIVAQQSPHESYFTIGPIFEAKQTSRCCGFQILKGLLGGYKKENGKRCFKFLWMTFG